MQIERSSLSTCHTATGLVVAIDVIRAFTTAAHLFHAGVDEIYLVSSVEEAFALREAMPGCLVAGEVGGIKVQGFDLGNSPSEIAGRNLTGMRVIQRTSAGTQGVVLASNASVILTAALANISATARYIQKCAPQTVTLIQTGLRPQEGWGDEDAACADAIEALLLGQDVDWEKVKERVRRSKAGLHFDGTRADFPPNDLELVQQIDRFDFAMTVERKNHLHVMRREGA